MAQIPAIDQFRWPGYLTIILSFLLGVVTMVWFREKRGDIYPEEEGMPCATQTPPNTSLCILFAVLIPQNSSHSSTTLPPEQ